MPSAFAVLRFVAVDEADDVERVLIEVRYVFDFPLEVVVFMCGIEDTSLMSDPRFLRRTWASLR
jgi:hypothetical protein